MHKKYVCKKGEENFNYVLVFEGSRKKGLRNGDFITWERRQLTAYIDNCKTIFKP